MLGPARSVMERLVNYHQTLEQCFIQVAKFLWPILGLRILTAVRHSHEKDMPSWIPDWSQNLPLDPTHFVVHSLEEEIYQPMLKLESQDNQTHAVYPILVGENEEELLITGCKYAHIDETRQACVP